MERLDHIVLDLTTSFGNVEKSLARNQGFIESLASRVTKLQTDLDTLKGAQSKKGTKKGSKK